MEIDWQTDGLAFSAQQLHVRGIKPEVTILQGERGDPVVLRPEAIAAPTTASSERITPIDSASDQTVQWKERTGLECTWSVSLLHHFPGLTLRGSLRNSSSVPIRLREFALCSPVDGSLEVDGDPSNWLPAPLAWDARIGTLSEKLRSLNEVTIATWEGFGMPIPFELPTDEKAQDGRWRSYADFVTLYSEQGNTGVALGAVGRPEADLRFDLFVDKNFIRLGIASEMTDVLVEPGETRDAQETLIMTGPYETAVPLMLRWVGATHGARTHRGPKFGWCSWYDRGSNITEQTVLDTARHFAKRRDELPIDVIQVDDGFQRQVGDWRCNRKFANGWDTIIETIREAGAEPGIWLAPLAVHDSLGFLHEHPDWFQRNASGALEGEANNWGPLAHWLDPTNPEVQHFLRKIIRDKRDAGFTYFKIDFNTIGTGCRLHNPKMTRLQAMRELYNLYREEVGNGVYLVACSGFQRGVMGYVDACRIGPDSSPVWQTSHPCTILEAIRAIGLNAIANGILFINDPDVTYLQVPGEAISAEASTDGGRVADRLRPEELRTWQGFVGLLGGMVFISDPIHKSPYRSSDAVRMLEILTPPAPDRGRPLHPGVDRNHQRFGFFADRTYDRFAAIQLWNPTDRPASVNLNTPRVGEQLGERFHAWSFWDESYRGIVTADYESPELPAHGSELLRFTPLASDGRPIVVGSGLHISMGSAEIADVAATENRLTILLTNAGAREGNLYIYSRMALACEISEGCRVMAVERYRGEGVWRVVLAERRSGKQRLVLKVADRSAGV